LINFDKMSTEIKFSNLSVDEILQIVEPIMDNCLEGLRVVPPVLITIYNLLIYNI
jgi:hypothetical protein